MKTTSDMKAALYEQIELLSNGSGDTNVAKTIAKVASQAIYATRIELENKRLELELAKSTKKVKKWMEKDFSNIQNIKG